MRFAVVTVVVRASFDKSGRPHCFGFGGFRGFRDLGI